VMVHCAARQSNATATARRARLFWRRADTLQRYREALVWWTGSSPPPKQSYPPIARLSPAPVQWSRPFQRRPSLRALVAGSLPVSYASTRGGQCVRSTSPLLSRPPPQNSPSFL
jgi:hypothetical protein